MSLISRYLVTSYAYYIENRSLLSDSQFDQLCKDLLACFDTIDHPHKHLIDKDALRAGSGFHLSKDQYPTIVKVCARNLIRRMEAQAGLI